MKDEYDLVVVCLKALSAWTQKRLGTIALTTAEYLCIVIHNRRFGSCYSTFCVLFYGNISNRLHNTSIGRTEIDLEENGRSLAGFLRG